MSLSLLIAAASVAAPSPSPAAVNVTAYPASFFAAASPNNAMDMVTLLPGFIFDGGGQVRGFGGAAGNVLIDGVRPAAKDDPLQLILQRIPASSILRIDVIRGSAPGIDMQGKTVIANVVRKTDDGTKLTLAASGLRAWDGRPGGALRIEGSSRKGSTTIEFALKAAHGFDDGEGDGTRVRTDASGTPILVSNEHNAGAADEYRANLSVETPVAGGKLRLSGSFTSQPYGLITLDQLSQPSGQEFERFHQDQKVEEFGLRYERSITPTLSSETFGLQQFSWGKISDQFMTSPDVSAVTGDDVSDVFLERRRGAESILREKLTWTPLPSLSIQFGGEGAYNSLVTRTSFIENFEPVKLPAANVRVTEDRGEAFTDATWTASKRLTVEAGLRVEASRIASTGDFVSSQSFTFPKPRLAVSYDLDRADQLRLRLEREVGQLNFDDFAAQSGNLATGEVHAGNPKLTPQQDWVIEGAWERKFWGGGVASVTGRAYRIDDVIDRIPIFDPAGTYDAPGNIGSGSKEELAFTLTAPLDKLHIPHGQITGTTTFRWSSVTDPTTLTPRPISGLHSNDWEAHFTQGLPKLKSIWGFDAYGQWSETYYRFNEIDTNKLRTYVSVFAEYKPRPDLVFRAELRNASGRGLENARVVSTGVRGVDPLDYVDVKNLHPGRILYFRITKMFG